MRVLRSGPKHPSPLRGRGAGMRELRSGSKNPSLLRGRGAGLRELRSGPKHPSPPWERGRGEGAPDQKPKKSTPPKLSKASVPQGNSSPAPSPCPDDRAGQLHLAHVPSPLPS